MDWIHFPLYAKLSAFLWILGTISIYLEDKNRVFRSLYHVFMVGGIVVFGTFITLLWIHLERPPMRTLGETRLWYAAFLPVVGYITYNRWKYKWFIAYTILMTLLFLIINLAHPENYDKALMPALQSVWFVPHVIVYIISYALLGVSSLVAVKGLYQYYMSSWEQKTLNLADNLVYIGFSFLTLGLLFGALWAKEAWGHYWTWDPKETWAFLTWLVYLIYIHFRYFQPNKVKAPLWVLSLAFVVLLICWFGINYLPSAQNSVHVYG